jgi:hypothetical protein
VDAERWQRVRSLLQDAITRDPAERAAFLDRACADRPDDRREVESLLQHHEGNPGFLEGGVGRVAADLLAGGRTLQPGDRVGGYLIEGEIARGGMGVVYLAQDIRLDRAVAIKALSPELSDDPTQRERLRREARAAAAVSHPGIAHVYSLEEGEDGAQYLVSEFVAGRTLRSEIDSGGLPPQTAASTALDIARAVGAAHARGIVHRDLKPENVMRAEDGSIKVLDFGLARPTAPLADARSRLTRAGASIGTPAYMSPEQLRGGDVGVATDVFGLGLVLYELAAGRHAFAANQALSTMVRMLDGDPDPLPPDVAARLPGLDRIVRRCLEKEPSARYGSMADVAAALQALLHEPLTAAAQRPLSGSPGTPQTSARRARASAQWWQVHQVVISVLYAAAIYPVWLARGEPVPRALHTTLLLALVAAAALAVTLRLHLVFTGRVHPDRVLSARRRASVWIRRTDWAVSTVLVAAAGAAIARGHEWLAALLVTLTACGTVAFLLIEPATTEAAFPADDTTG